MAITPERPAYLADMHIETESFAEVAPMEYLNEMWCGSKMRFANPRSPRSDL